MQHEPDEVLATILWRNRGLGADPSPWLTYSAAAKGSTPTGTRPTTAWPVFSGAEPAEPDNVITVYNTTPEYQTRVLTGEIQQLLGLQVRVRGKPRKTVAQKARAIQWDFERNFLDQQITLADPTQQYLVPCLSWVQVLDLKQMPVHPYLWLFTINVLCKVLPYPIQG
jgi:hypothetical protein